MGQRADRGPIAGTRIAQLGNRRWSANRGGHRWSNRGRWHHRHGWRHRVGPAFGFALGTYPYWGNSYAYDYGYAPYGGAYAMSPGYDTGDRDVAYCMRRFKSYDPASGTYLGYDGIRHPCP